VGMTEVGILFSLFSIGMILGGILGGAFSDKYGRRVMILFGIIISGTGSLVMGFVDDLNIFYLLAAILGIFGSMGGPAQQAMIADLLPEELRAEGYGILRIATNLSVAIGPALGGLLAAYSYFYLFMGDFIFSIITALIVFFVIPESKPELSDHESEESIGRSFARYAEIFKDGIFLLFILFSMMMALVYMQMNSTLSVFLRDTYNFSEQSFGLLISMNAAMVVLLQFWITKRISKFAPMKVIAIGTFIYAVGFGMYGFVTTVPFFFIAMIIITIGEMIISPFQQKIVAQFAPEDMRGRYMAVSGFAWAVPSIFGIILAGIIVDNYDGKYVWYLSIIICLVSAIGFLLIHQPTLKRLKTQKKEEMSIQSIVENS
jgi:MFS family permease